MTLSLLGIGVESAGHRISKSAISSFNPSCPPASSVLSSSDRFSVLDPARLALLNASSSEELLTIAQQTPTDLSERAARLAIEAAGLEVEQIGLVIGDNSIPIQTMPSEGQRVAGKLGLKVPAYDITAGTGALVAQLATLSKMKSERLPEYALCVSANTPTQSIDYRKSSLGGIFSDGAGAVVVSRTHAGRASLIATELQTSQTTLPCPITIPTYGFVQGDLDSYISYLWRESVGALVSVASKFSGSLSRMKFSLPPCVAEKPGAREEVISLSAARGVKLSREQILEAPQHYGDMFGSSPFFQLHTALHGVAAGEILSVVVAGPGVRSGYLLFEVR